LLIGYFRPPSPVSRPAWPALRAGRRPCRRSRRDTIGHVFT